MKKSLFVLAVAAMFCSLGAKAQNLQIFYDFGSDRKQVTTTFEMFKGDNWGNTFWFVDLDYTFKQNVNDKFTNVGIGGAYMEIARCLNFWQNTALGGLSLQVEYNGGIGSFYGPTGTTDGAFAVNHSFLAGLDYFFHSANFNNTLNLKVLYKSIVGCDQAAPLQLTAVWGLQDLFGAKGLRFSGFVDFWWQNQVCDPYSTDPKNTKGILLSEPQLWYAIGQHFGCPNLNIGGEVELAYNFATVSGFKARPCLGIKWDF